MLHLPFFCGVSFDTFDFGQYKSPNRSIGSGELLYLAIL